MLYTIIFNYLINFTRRAIYPIITLHINWKSVWKLIFCISIDALYTYTTKLINQSHAYVISNSTNSIKLRKKSKQN